MPHLNETESKKSESVVTIKKNNSTPEISELIPNSAQKDSRLSPMNGVDQLLSVAATAVAAVKAVVTSAVTVTKQHQPDERQSPEESTPSHSSHKQMITPSPLTGAPPGSKPRPVSREAGPMLSIYGNSRIYTSPIRVKNSRLPTSEAVKQPNPNASLALPTMKHPSNLRYGSSPSSLAPPRRISYGRVSSDEEQQLLDKKRQVESPDINEMVKRARTAKSVRIEASHVKEPSAKQESNSAEPTEPPFVVPAAPKKKAIISPSHSGEKGDQDETKGPAHQKGAAYPLGARPYPHAPYPPPHMHPYGMRPPYGAPMPPPYGNGHAMYTSYPPHYMDGRHAAPPSYYSPYPPHPHPHPMMHHYRHPSQLPPPYPGAPSPAAFVKGAAAAASVKASKQTKSPLGTDDGNSIKSVAEWQKAAIATGKAPSANRCIPLEEPIPSKYWGEAEKTKDAILPDFHRLVNYPDYLAKPRSVHGSDSASSTTNGKKNCVMCGKLRVCSASNYRGGRKPEDAVTPTTTTTDAKDDVEEQDQGGCAHIIPRQNKGLCTACDITVWVVGTDGLEIKWCKGCKNFRPWAAFGDKGSATKCVRCRDRQREKYAMQKGEIRTTTRRVVTPSSPDSPSSTSIKQEKKEDATYLAAASGLHHLMNAAATSTSTTTIC